MPIHSRILSANNTTGILTPILYYTNTWYSKYMPISSTGSYDNTGSPYDVSQILTPEGTFDIDKYQAYSPLFLSTTFALSYGLSFASITGTFLISVVRTMPDVVPSSDDHAYDFVLSQANLDTSS